VAALAVLATSLATVPSASARCAPGILCLALLTPAETALAPQSAPVVALESRAWRTCTQRDPSVETIDVVLSSGARVTARLDWIAPGLARVAPASPWPAGRHEIDGVSGERSFHVATAAMPQAPGGPVLAGMTRRVSSGRWGTMIGAGATLATPVPAGVVATISRWTSARSWARAVAGATTVDLHATPSRCAARVEGQAPPDATDRGRVAFVDAHGRVSAWSSEREVR
jgi:hypothetical protein